MEPITSAKYLREDIDDNNNESKDSSSSYTKGNTLFKSKWYWLI